MAGSTEKKLGKSSKPKSKSKAKSKHRIKHMHIESADNGGFMARHSYEPGEPDENGQSQQEPDTTHALGGPDELLQHVQSNLGGQLPQAAPQGDGAAGPAGPGGM